MKTSPEYSDRISIWIEVLRKDFFIPLGPLEFEAFFTHDKLSIADALSRDFTPAPKGLEWGSEWEYGWFRTNVTFPEEANGEMIALSIANGAESLLYVDEKPFGTVRAGWLHYSHHSYQDNLISLKGVPGEKHSIVTETYCGHWFPGCITGPVIGGNLEPDEIKSKVGDCSFGIWNEDAYQLWADALVLKEIMDYLPDGSLRGAQIYHGLIDFTNIVDFEIPLADRRALYKSARLALAPLLAAKNGSTAPVMHGIGNAHIDVAWLWPLQETERKTARTFAAQLRMIDMYPEYKFLQSQPHLYKMCKEKYPEVYEGIKKAVKDGRWICEGGEWVESDTNMPSGEALIRQILHGTKFFKDEFGVTNEVFWLPDTFGYSGALPQIIKGCGLKYMFTQKIFWAYNESQKFPYNSFIWEGIDGSEVRAFLSTSYLYLTNPKTMNETWTDRRCPESLLDSYLIPYGYGDGGGGPSRDYIEFGIRQKDLEGAPNFKFSSPHELFTHLDESFPNDNKYTGELYCAAHRGTLTSQSRTKRNNRKAEFALREAEIWGSVSTLPYPAEAMRNIWETVLLNQFHDILPGSSIARVYEEAEAQMAKAITEANEVSLSLASSLVSPGQGISVFNSLSWERTALIELPDFFASGASTSLGEKIPVSQKLALVKLPSYGTLCLVPDESNKKAANPVEVAETESGIILDNGLVQVKVLPNGEIESFSLKSFQANQGPLNRFHLYKDLPRTFDAWDIDVGYIENEVPLDDSGIISLLSSSPLQASVKVEKTIGNSKLSQIITLSADSPVLVFDTEIDWHELHKLLKVSFPSSIQSQDVFNEIQFGYIKRPTHRSRQSDKDMFEVTNHKYSAIANGSRGIAVLNDCKYGVSALGGEISLSLLRAPSAPDFKADNGIQKFTYAFTAFEGPFSESDIVRLGYELNVQPLVIDGVCDEKSFFQVSSKAVILDTVKPAEEGSGIILRLYESLGTNATAILTTPLPVKEAFFCDMLENVSGVADLSKLDFRPFEVKTVKLAL
ncbi:MAG: glycosyl hydrolase-related protein [Clostridiales bacterium]|nr:glycosyl hydrolase-related protein [Clostridiales bacterium]